MKEMLGRIKADMILSAVLCVVMGVVIFVWPATTIDLMCKVLAVGMIIFGAVQLVAYFFNRMDSSFSGVLGLIAALVGLWIFTKPESIVSLIPIVIGVILMIHGMQDIKLAFEAKSNRYGRWWSMLLIAVVSLAFGVLCIVNAFGMVKLALKIIGVALIYDGLSDLWIVNRTAKAAKTMREMEKALEVEYKEVGGDSGEKRRI